MPSKTTLKSHIPYQKQRGNALVIILILIALLAALTAVAMRSSSRSSSNMDTETARVQAEKLIRSGQNIQMAVNKLLTTNGCGENQLSFLNTATTTDYTNAAAPSDGHCELFSLNGAGLTYSEPESAILDSAKSALSEYGDWSFKATQCVLGVGSDDDNTCANNEIALIAFAPHIALPVCLQINTLSGIANPSGAPPQENADDGGAAFTGSFAAAAGAEIGDAATGTGLASHASGCFQDAAGGWNDSYIYYQVLYAR